MTLPDGIIPPLVTPLRDRDTLDIDGLSRLVEHVLGGDVSGLFILGTSGEAPSLSCRLRGEFIGRVCNLVDGRVPVLVGITDTAFVESVNLARIAADAGADAVVLTTPYYFPAGQTELTDYVRHLVPELPLPLVLYNMPALTKVPFEIETLRILSEIPEIIGVKDSGGDLDYFARLTRLASERPDWRFFMGPEHLLVNSLKCGGHGGVHGGANIYPKLFVDLYDAFVAGDSGMVAQLEEKVSDLQAIYSVGKYASRHIKAMKCALSLLGICDDFMAEPFHRFKAPERRRIAELIEQPLG